MDGGGREVVLGNHAAGDDAAVEFDGIEGRGEMLGGKGWLVVGWGVGAEGEYGRGGAGVMHGWESAGACLPRRPRCRSRCRFLSIVRQMSAFGAFPGFLGCAARVSQTL